MHGALIRSNTVIYVLKFRFSDPVFRSLIAKQISLCREGLKEQEEHMKATYRNMFSQPSGSGDHG